MRDRLGREIAGRDLRAGVGLDEMRDDRGGFMRDALQVTVCNQGILRHRLPRRKNAHGLNQGTRM